MDPGFREPARVGAWPPREPPGPAVHGLAAGKREEIHREAERLQRMAFVPRAAASPAIRFVW